MKHIAIALLALSTLIFSSCERHDGKLYFKQVCNAEFEGKKYIDQCPLSYIFAPSVTPFIHEWEYGGIEFTTNLCEKREGPTVIRLQLYMPCDGTDNIVGHRFEFTYDENFSGSWWEYHKYCSENGFNTGDIYAPTLNVEPGVIKSGWFIIESKDKNDSCRGSFEVTTLDNLTLAGHFANVLLPQLPKRD